MAESISNPADENSLYTDFFETLDIPDLVNMTNGLMQSRVADYLKNRTEINMSKEPFVQYSVGEFKKLFKFCKKIKELNFSRCTWLTDAHLGSVILNNIQTLETVNLKFCKQITLDAVQKLAKCPNLITFSLDSRTLYGRNWNETEKFIQTMDTDNNFKIHSFLSFTTFERCPQNKKKI